LLFIDLSCGNTIHKFYEVTNFLRRLFLSAPNMIGGLVSTRMVQQPHDFFLPLSWLKLMTGLLSLSEFASGVGSARFF